VSRRRKKVALVIGSGAIRCAAAIGVQRVLAREGIDLDLVVGCSGGSIFAALIALGLGPAEAQEVTERVWRRDVTHRRSTRAILQVLLPRLVPFDERFGLVDDRPILAALKQGYGSRTFADTRLPLRLVATDFKTGEKVVLTEGSLVDAIRASIAIPFVFPAWEVNGRHLIDGSQVDPMPIDVAMREGADVILAVGCHAPNQTRVDSVARYAFQVTTIMTNHLLEANYAFHSLSHHDEVLPIVPEFQGRVGAFDTDKVPQLVADGEKAMEARLPYLLKLLEGRVEAGVARAG
jgi:NTE family protein